MSALAVRDPRVRVAPVVYGATSVGGARLILAAFVLTQFVAYSFGGGGSGGVTLQKVIAGSALPLGLVMLGHVRSSAVLGVLFVSLTAALATRPVIESGLEGLIRPLGVTVPGLLGAVALYTALTSYPGAFRWFARAWVVAAMASSTLSIAQAVGRVPLWLVDSDALDGRETGVAGFVRATGLQFDPNFQALVLVVGLAFVVVLQDRWRNIAGLLLFAGVLSTFSRMGILLALIIWFGQPLVQAIRDPLKRRTALRRLGVISVALLAAWGVVGALAPTSLQEYAETRAGDLVRVVEGLTGGEPSPAESGQVNQSSGDTRLELLGAAREIIGENPTIGVGAFNVEERNFELIGQRIALHNTYLELLAVGGLLGAWHLAAYGAMLLAKLRRAGRGWVEARAAGWVAITVGGAAATLTLVYNSILWLPVVLALTALRNRELYGGAHGARGVFYVEPMAELGRVGPGVASTRAGGGSA